MQMDFKRLRRLHSHSRSTLNEKSRSIMSPSIRLSPAEIVHRKRLIRYDRLARQYRRHHHRPISKQPLMAMCCRLGNSEPCLMCVVICANDTRATNANVHSDSILIIYQPVVSRSRRLLPLLPACHTGTGIESFMFLRQLQQQLQRLPRYGLPKG